MAGRVLEVDDAPQFAAALRAYRAAQRAGDHAIAEGLAGWLAGQPHVAASVKRVAGIKGDVDHYAALSFLRGLLLILKDSGYTGLVLVLDEIETLQRVRGDVREKGLNALRQLIDDIDSGRFPNLYLLTTGTPAFFDEPHPVGLHVSAAVQGSLGPERAGQRPRIDLLSQGGRSHDSGPCRSELENKTLGLEATYRLRRTNGRKGTLALARGRPNAESCRVSEYPPPSCFSRR